MTNPPSVATFGGGGEYDCAAIADSLADLVAPERTMDELRKLAAGLEGLELERALIPTE